ncbi:SEC-C domain-containing protein [Seohaeicola nanhaiensis]|uniref:SEC-C domain-containing protein n=1 Tax=Seohaeicola nanhaiensis TaxID=1387282 RepID=A0ABV9KBX4_9RHOB
MYHYDHFDPEFKYAESHEAKGIILLCPTHHEEKKKGLLTNAQLREFWRSPFAKSTAGAHYPIRLDHPPEIILSKLIFTAGTVALRTDDETILGVKPPDEAGLPPLLTFVAQDKVGNVFLRIKDNEILFSSSSFDIETTGQNWKILSSDGSLEIRMSFDLPTRITFSKILMYFGPWRISSSESSLDFSHKDKGLISMSTKGEWLRFGPEHNFALSSELNAVVLYKQDMSDFAPAPLGSLPTKTEPYFALNPPYYVVWDDEEDNISPVEINTAGLILRRYVRLFLRPEDAYERAKGSLRVLEIGNDNIGPLLTHAFDKVVATHLIFDEHKSSLWEYYIPKFVKENILPAGVGRRNAGCFCGSRKKYKHCHGAPS